MSQNAVQKSSLIVRLAALELLMARVELQQEQASFRKNQLVSDQLVASHDELKTIFKAMSEEDYSLALQTLKIVWFRLTLANRIMQADNTEATLGNGNFLELSAPQAPWEPLVEEGYNAIDQKLRGLKAAIMQRRKSKKDV